MLGIAWFACEACGIIVLATVVGIGIVTKTPYCEESRCWLDKTKKHRHPRPVRRSHPARRFRCFGDLSPLTAAKAQKFPARKRTSRALL